MKIARFIKALCAFMVIFLAACTVTPVVEMSPDALEDAWSDRNMRLMAMDAWRLQGRVAVSNEHDSWSASLLWRESDHSQEVRVVAPLGQGTAVVRREEHGLAELQLSNGEVFVGESASELLHQQLGWYLPVESLAYWIKGVPDPNYVSSWALNRQGGLSHLTQAGWQVEYKRYRHSELFDGDLPSKLFLTRDDWKVKLIVQNWQDFEK